jgi:hypothetical protein
LSIQKISYAQKSVIIHQAVTFGFVYVSKPTAVKTRRMATKLSEMDSCLHFASMGVYSTSGGQGRSELRPGACGVVAKLAQMCHSEPKMRAWGKGSPHLWPWALATCHRAAVCGVARPWVQRAPRCCCARVRACTARGMACPCGPVPKVYDGSSEVPNKLHMIYESCWEGVHAGGGPRAVFCDWNWG